MKFERSDIKHPLWRKKVDSSLFHKAHTPIPNWCAKNWKMESTFGKNTSKLTPVAQVKIRFNKKLYHARVTYSFNKDTSYQIFLPDDFVEQLKDTFIMSYMRSLEQRLRKNNKEYEDRDLEKEVPFWEFLDIEYDGETKIFHCKAHYKQEAIFPELFKQFINSHILKGIENKLLNKGEFKFIKENWRRRSEFEKSLVRKNFIYYLIDTKNKLLYIGESDHNKRLISKRAEIPDWDYFRVDFLPEWMTRGQRLELERLIIRSFASLLKNLKSVKSHIVSDYLLVNKKIDN
jgi:hypothetical protein